MKRFCLWKARSSIRLLVAILTLGSSLYAQAPQQWQLAQATTVNAGGRAIQIPAGQSVTVLGVTSGAAMIRITLPDGSLSIAQVPATLLQQKPAVTAAANSAPAEQPQASPPPPASQFSLNPGSTSGSAASGSETMHKDWRLVWSDDFNGASIDPSKWTFEVNGNGGGNGEMEYYTDFPKNAHLADGKLFITAIKERYQNKNYTSARMTTKDKFSFKYGRVEARIKMPKGKGYWPAFWMMPQDSVYGGWARSGEVDIAEVIGDKPSILYGTLHYGDKWPKNTHTGDKTTLPSGDFSDDFHVFAIEWQEGEIRWYLDDKLYETQTRWYTAGGTFPAPFDQKFNIILNVAVGGAWPGPPSPATVFPQSMEIDYVRVYQPAGLVH